MSNPKVQAVIFDCDGTLVDSEKLSIAVLVDFVAEFGYQIALPDALRNWAGGELPKIFAKVEQELGVQLPGDHLNQFRSRQMARLATDVEAIDGAADLLESLTLPYCVASNAPLNKVGLCLETTGLARFFPDARRFSAYEIEKWKPEPDLFLMAARALGVPAERCVVVEDSLYGIEAGLNAGMTVFAYDAPGELQLPEGVAAIRNLVELKGLLQPA